MSPKNAGTTIVAPPKPRQAQATAGAAVDPASQWKEALLVYPLYAALTEKFGFAASPYAVAEAPPSRPTRPMFERHMEWMSAIDSRVLAYQIRQIPPETLNGSEKCLRALDPGRR